MNKSLFIQNRKCLLWGLLFSLIIVGGCSLFEKKKIHKSPPGYDLNHPIRIKLPLELDEISGVAFLDADTSILAINDEFGMLYKIPLNRQNNIEKWPFSKGADFEDLVLLDSTFYVLKSTGDIISFRYITRDSIFHADNQFPFGGGNEFEILYYDKFKSKLILICKDCEGDNKKYLSTYSFDPVTLQYATDSFTIDAKRIAKMMNEKKIKFKPSAAAIHPISGDLYIISSVNKLIVITDHDGKAKELYKIDPGMFKQPEGISFTPRGTMIISNEAADVGVADILIFPYQQILQKN